MEIAKTELVQIEKAIEKGAEIKVRELADLQLALVGGGMGDVSFG